MELIERNDHYIEIPDTGMPIRHYSKFVSFNGKLVRMDTDPVTGAITPSMFTPRSLITADKATGEIKQHQTSFIVEHELIGPGVHPDPLLEYVMAELPDDFTVSRSVKVIETQADGTKKTLPNEDVTRTAYKVVSGKLVKLSAMKLNEAIKRVKV